MQYNSGGGRGGGRGGGGVGTLVHSYDAAACGGGYIITYNLDKFGLYLIIYLLNYSSVQIKVSLLLNKEVKCKCTMQTIAATAEAAAEGSCIHNNARRRAAAAILYHTIFIISVLFLIIHCILCSLSL